MYALYIQGIVTLLYTVFSFFNRSPPYLGRPRNTLSGLCNTLKGSVQLILEFSRQLSMAFLISILIFFSSAHGSLHLQLLAGLAAVSLAISNLILEIIFWEWYQPPMPSCLFIPLSFMAFFAPETIFINVHNAPVADSVPFYELCYDFEAVNRVTSMLHGIVAASQPLAVLCFYFGAAFGGNSGATFGGSYSQAAHLSS